MSDCVTWEVCPKCGCVAAVGWALDVWTAGEAVENRAVEFDCPTGCQISLDLLAEVYELLAHRTPPAGA